MQGFCCGQFPSLYSTVYPLQPMHDRVRTSRVPEFPQKVGHSQPDHSSEKDAKLKQKEMFAS